MCFDGQLFAVLGGLLKFVCVITYGIVHVARELHQPENTKGKFETEALRSAHPDPEQCNKQIHTIVTMAARTASNRP